MEYVLTTNGLCKNYRNFKALNNLSMHDCRMQAQESTAFTATKVPVPQSEKFAGAWVQS